MTDNGLARYEYMNGHARGSETVQESYNGYHDDLLRVCLRWRQFEMRLRRGQNAPRPRLRATSS